MKKILAKNTDHEFEIDLPFTSKRSLNKAQLEFKKKYYPELVGKKVSCYEFYLQFIEDPTITVDYIKPSTAVTKKSMLRKYGKIEGERRWAIKCTNDSIKGTLKYYTDKYGDVVGKRRYQDKNSKLSVSESALRRNGKNDEEIKAIRDRHSQGSSHIIDNYIKRYGRLEGIKRFELYREKMKEVDSSKFPSQSQYWINLGYSKVDADIKVAEFQSKTLDNFIEIYGVDEGKRRYELYIKSKVGFSNKVGKSSKESLKIFIPLYKWLVREFNYTKESIMIGLSGSEEFAIVHDNGVCLYDFTIPSLGLIFEYHGEAFHPNPKWKECDIDRWNNWKCVYRNYSADRKRNIDVNKNKIAVDLGYDVVELWSSDKVEDNLNKIKEIIRNRYENKK